MARRIALLHIGPVAPGPAPAATATHGRLSAHEDLLAQAGCALVDLTAADLESAALEMLRQHKDAGLRRRDVEGAWSHVCRRAHRSRVDTVISQPRFAEASGDQAALILDGLTGFEIHVAVTAHPADDPVAEVVETWSPHLRTDRLHVLRLDEDAAAVDLAEELAGVMLCAHRDRAPRTVTPLGRRRGLRRRTHEPIAS